MCQWYGNTWSPPINVVLPVATICAGLGTLLIVIALSTTAWEEVTWDNKKLKDHSTLNGSLSYFSNKDGFYIAITTDNENSGNLTTSYLRNMKGGIWQMCDTVSEKLRKTNRFKTAMDDANFLKYDCFNYVTQYTERKDDGLLDKKAVSLVRMQNSAASCSIVTIMCLSTAGMLGFLGVWKREVSVVTVTGVMYIVSATFVCFVLVIMTTKVGYYQDYNQCHSIDTIRDKTLCKYRNAVTSWSIPIVWLAFTFLVISFSCWLLLSRSLRLEKIKAAML